ncbi:hypothetical protein A3709_19960 [Halioglobus sp. HI00S01]|uniref:DnaT-like ssDNA-binding domain-containing protein n=1 Tax=Halioglobus sp. HI00S01 TaxID=1822214 RepID=UPI0007C2046E|nr:DnaT-like ssDNA-binding domain-containing protein [Halioglobus sp. HI00S01]KZX57901.1 hypothetical protein A3709_19960 [Halioglobus sp. HI00S01]
MKSLDLEPQVLFSPSLAKQIGLDEAVMLQQLEHVASLHDQPGGSEPWRSIPLSSVRKAMPWWESATVNRVLRSLVAQSVIVINSPDSKEGVLSWRPGSPEADHPMIEGGATADIQSAPPPRPPAKLAPAPSATAMRKDWRPSEDLLQMLAMNYSIPREFAMSRIDDFIFYWCERGTACHAWENRFRQWILSQWHKRIKHAETTPTQSADLPPDWQPDSDATDLLQDQGIPADFLKTCIPEFRIYWAETSHAKHSPSTSFIRHARTAWSQHQMHSARTSHASTMRRDWEPSHHALDILAKAGIGEEQITDALPEFVLYWTDQNTARSDWNTKFIAHCKYRFKTQRTSVGLSTRERSLRDDLEDTSWV